MTARTQPPARLVIRNLLRTGGACPSQWEGCLADGRALYIHFRHGNLRITTGATMSDAITYATVPMILTVEHATSVKSYNPQTFQQEVVRRRERIPGGETICDKQLSDEFDGVLTDDELRIQTQDLLSFIQIDSADLD